MHDLPKKAQVSVVIITYNSSAYIIETLESIRLQEYPHIELIVSDDCSTDDTVSLCKEWTCKNSSRFSEIQIISSPTNQGIPANCNQGIRKTSGEYVKILAGDDTLTPNYISTCVEKFDIHGDSYKMCFTNGNIIDENSNVTGEILPATIDPRCTFESLLSGNYIPALSVCMRREVFDDLGYFDESIWIEDWEYWIRIASKYPFFYIKSHLCNYRVHSNSITAKKSKVAAEWQILKKYGWKKKYRPQIHTFVFNHFFGTDERQLVRRLYDEYPFKSTLVKFALQNNFPKLLMFAIRKLYPQV